MFKMSHTLVRRLVILAGCILILLAFMYVDMPVSHAAGTGTISISPNVGRPGTQITITGSNFDQDGTLRLFTTANPARCSGNGSPNALGLKQFTTSPTVTVTGGSFSAMAPWPDNANTMQTPYYICALPAGNNGNKILSSNTFTIADQAAITSVTPNTVQQGGKVTISGSNWTPAQEIVTINVFTSGGSSPTTSAQTPSDANGNFNYSITLPPDAPAGTYKVVVTSAQDPNQTATMENAFTVTPATATPTTSPTTTASPTDTTTPTATTPNATPTSTAGTGDTNGQSGIPTALLVAAGGAGVLFLIVGIMMFIFYSRTKG